MNTNALGDLAQGYALRSRSAAMKQDMQRLSLELSTGQTADVRASLAGNYSFLTDVNTKLGTMESYEVATSEATIFTAQMQTALENFSGRVSDLSGMLMSAGTSISGAPTGEITREAAAMLDSMVTTLNGSVAGRSMFSGIASDRPALIGSDALIDNLRTAIAGTFTPSDMATAAEAWFNDPAGFAATSYLGSAEQMSPFKLSAEDTLSVGILGSDMAFRDNLRAAALASLAGDPAFGLSKTEQRELFKLTGQTALVGQDEITGLQARVGFAESRIETIAARNAGQVSSLTIARNTLLEADPFATATQLEEVQFQLQSLYSVTVRMSQLSLVNYL